MNFTCPSCGNNSFIVANDNQGSPNATCGKCGKVIPFQKELMTNAPLSEGEQVPPAAHPDQVH